MPFTLVTRICVDRTLERYVAGRVQVPGSSGTGRVIGGADMASYPMLEMVPLDESRGRKRTRVEKDAGRA